MVFTKFDPVNKCSETATHFFFLNGPLSQWYPCTFSCALVVGGQPMVFNCAEQFMMAAKANLFSDMDALDQIVAVSQKRDWREAPKKQKAIGRTVKGFDPALWDVEAQEIVFRGNLAKFDQNPALGLFLDQTGDKIIVEGAHYDSVWGVGLSWDDERITDPDNWQGSNWLGQALMRVREARRRARTQDQAAEA